MTGSGSTRMGHALSSATCFSTHAVSTRDRIIRSEAGQVDRRDQAERELAIGLAEALLCARSCERTADSRRDSRPQSAGHPGGRCIRGVSSPLSAHGGTAGNLRCLLRWYPHLHQAHLAVEPDNGGGKRGGREAASLLSGPPAGERAVG